MRLSRVVTHLNRQDLLDALTAAPVGSHFELIDAPRTLAQNRMMWWLLNDIAMQVPIAGVNHDAEAWKSAFLKQLGKKLEFMPSLDGKSVVCIGYSSSRLSKGEMAEMITSILTWGDEHGVKFRIDDEHRKQLVAGRAA